MHHKKYKHIKAVVEADINVLLEGPAGSGKTTIAKELAKDLGLTFSSISMTKQTSLAALIGFISVTGEYVPTNFRKAVEEGHLFLIDELDAADPNVLLSLNTLENGYIAFPDGVKQVHKDFRLIATANPQSEHSVYTGRSKLDFSTMDRYHNVIVPIDAKLEATITSQEIHETCTDIRKYLKSQGSSIQVTMRDAIRIHKLTEAGISGDHYKNVVFHSDISMYTAFKKEQERLAEERRKAEEERIRKEKEEAERREAERVEAERQAAYDKLTQHEVETYSEYLDKIAKGK